MANFRTLRSILEGVKTTTAMMEMVEIMIELDFLSSRAIERGRMGLNGQKGFPQRELLSLASAIFCFVSLFVCLFMW